MTERKTRITSILKNMHVANQIYKDMALMTQEQTEQVEVIHHNLESTEDNVK